MNDSGMYVGACLQVCDVTIDHAWMENNALGYSGTNSGGAIVIENSQFDNNEDGVDTNTQIAGDPPPPAERRLPRRRHQPDHPHPLVLGLHPQRRARQQQPRRPRGRQRRGRPDRHRHDALRRAQRHGDGQHVREQRRLGHALRPVPRLGHAVAPPEVQRTTAGFQISGLGCVFETENDALTGNTYVHDGFFGNPSNADFGQIVLHSGLPSNCYADNSGAAGELAGQPGAAAAHLWRAVDRPPTSTTRWSPRSSATPAWVPARRGRTTRRRSGVHLEPLPQGLPTMANPCAGVPSNAWCASGSSLGSTTRHGGHSGQESGARIASGTAYRRATL